MVFDIRAYMESEGLDYKTSGPNIMKVHVGFNCPKCAERGDPDPSYHLNLKIDGTHAICFRCQYKSKNAYHIWRDILRPDARLDFEEFKKICEEFEIEKVEDSYIQEQDDSQRINKKEKNFDKLWDSFRRFKIKPDHTYKSYLLRRNIDVKYCKNIGVKIGTRGYKWRVIFPIRNDTGKIVSFSARAIVENMEPRYLNASGAERIENYPFGLYESLDSKNVILTEGVIDALKCLQNGIGAIALGTTDIIYLYKELIVENFEKDTTFFIALDSDLKGDEIYRKKIEEDLNVYFSVKQLSFTGAKDIGAMTNKEIKRLKKLLQKT